ncbi:hypothetical protein [Paenibacillus sp. FSL F4-0097]
MNELLNQAGKRIVQGQPASQLTNKKTEQRYSNKRGIAALLS